MFDVRYQYANPTTGHIQFGTLQTDGLVPFSPLCAIYSFERPRRGLYSVQIVEPGQYAVLVMAFEADKPGATFEHNNIARTRKKVLEYKHYGSGGNKWWALRPGVEHVLVVPREKISIELNSDDPGYSYVPVFINGAKVVLNVSGGTCGEGWMDWIGKVPHTLTNYPVEVLKAVADVAVRDTEYEPFRFYDEE